MVYVPWCRNVGQFVINSLIYSPCHLSMLVRQGRFCALRLEFSKVCWCCFDLSSNTCCITSALTLNAQRHYSLTLYGAQLFLPSNSSSSMGGAAGDALPHHTYTHSPWLRKRGRMVKSLFTDALPFALCPAVQNMRGGSWNRPILDIRQAGTTWPEPFHVSKGLWRVVLKWPSMAASPSPSLSCSLSMGTG